MVLFGDFRVYLLGFTGESSPVTLSLDPLQSLFPS